MSVKNDLFIYWIFELAKLKVSCIHRDIKELVEVWIHRKHITGDYTFDLLKRILFYGGKLKLNIQWHNSSEGLDNV